VSAPATPPDAIALRGPAISFRGDPFVLPESEALHYESDALVLVRAGRIEAFGAASALLPTLPSDVVVRHYPRALITPGFIDAHVHYPQLAVIGACGHSLLDWLEQHTFPAEAAFADPALARSTAELFLDQCIREGTTTAAVYGTVHAASAEAFFAAAHARGMRMMAGQVWMDRHAPPELLQDAQAAYDDTRSLIARWHGRDRLAYALTPRFAPTSSEEQLDRAGSLLREHPGLYLQTHLAENAAEVAWVQSLFPAARDYLDVYDRHGLLGRRSVFGHGLHLDAHAWQRLHEAGSTIAHCPTSNAFLASGHFRLRDAKANERPVHVALATDVGGGMSLSMLATMAEAYKVARYTGFDLTPAQAWWLATAGAAAALDLDGVIGNLAPGCEADVVVLDPAATPLLAYRTARSDSIRDLMGVLITLGDDRAVAATWIGGRPLHERQEIPPAADPRRSGKIGG
jgi:guanine deaminase